MWGWQGECQWNLHILFSADVTPNSIWGFFVYGFVCVCVCVCVTGHVAVDLSFLCQSFRDFVNCAVCFQLQANKSESYQFLCFTIKETIGASCLMTFQTTCKFNTGKPVCQWWEKIYDILLMWHFVGQLKLYTGFCKLKVFKFALRRIKACTPIMLHSSTHVLSVKTVLVISILSSIQNE